MNKALAHTILTIGIVLLLFGLGGGHSIVAREALTGTPTGNRMVLVVVGVIAVVVGGSSSFFRRHN